MTPLLSNAATAPYRLRAFAHVTRPCRHCIHTAAWAPLPWRNPQHLQRPHRPQRSARPLLSLRPHCSAVAAEAPPSAAAAAPTVAKVDQLDYTALAACAHELREAWLPSKVESVVMADETTLALCLRSVARTGWLHVSWHPVAARVCVGEQPERGEASEAFPLGALVNAKLRGQVLTGVSMPVPFDRVVQLDFAKRLDEGPALHLFCEAQGRFSNAVLTDGAKTVLLAGRQIGAAQTAARSVRVGETYALPPVAPGVTPALDEAAATWRSNVQGAAALDDGRAASVAAALARAYQGVSPPLSAELCAAAGVDPRGSAVELSDSDWNALHAAWTAWLQRLREGDFAPCRAAAGGGGVSMLGMRPEAYESVHVCVDTHYREAQARERFHALHATLRRAIAKAESSLQGKLKAFEKQLGSSEDAAVTQKEGDMIMANVYQWKAGSDSVDAQDWDTGETVTLRIADAAAGPVECAQKLFKRAAKQRRAQERVTPLMEAAEAQLTYVREVDESLQELGQYIEVEDLRALQGVQDELVEGGLMKPPADSAMAAKGKAKAGKAKRKGRVAPGGEHSKFRRFESPSGLQVLIGRNNHQNDELSTRVANNEDIWMHARGVPGSHLIVRAQGGKEPSEEDIQFAANLSTFFSKARSSPRWDVTMCSARDLRKPKGAKPGQILVLKESVVTGVPEDSAAAKLERSG